MSLLQLLRAYWSKVDLQPYLVGGSVRDAILGRPTHDIDLAIEGDAMALASTMASVMNGSYVPIDPKNGVSRVILSGSDGPWQVDIAKIQGDGILHDLGRRDFTVNAMAVNLGATVGESATWPILDPHGGLQDLEKRLLRVVGPKAFEEDPVRLLRVLRLATQLGFRITPDTLALARRDAHYVSTVPGERARDELLAILAQPEIEPSLRLMDELGLLCTMIPELEVGKGVSQPKTHHYWDVFEHGIQCAIACNRILSPKTRATDTELSFIPWEAWLDDYFLEEATDGHNRATLLKLVGLLHDIGKPATKNVEPSGRVRFLGHPTIGADMVIEILRRLRVSGRGINMAKRMVEHHLRPSHLSHQGEQPTRRAIHRYFRDIGDVSFDILYLNMADYLAARGPSLEMTDWSRHCKNIGVILEQGSTNHGTATLPRLVDGNDLKEILQLRPGPIFRPLLEAVQEAQVSGGVNTRQEALDLVDQLLRQNGLCAEERHV